MERIGWERRRISFVGKGHLVGAMPLPPNVMQDIRFYLAGRKVIFFRPAKKGGALTNVLVNRIVAEIDKRAGLKSPNTKSTTGNIKPRMLRHIYARLCKDMGLGTEAAQRPMRHARFKTSYDLYDTMDFENVQALYETQFLERV